MLRCIAPALEPNAQLFRAFENFASAAPARNRNDLRMEALADERD
jgi:hypothetical protein